MFVCVCVGGGGWFGCDFGLWGCFLKGEGTGGFKFGRTVKRRRRRRREEEF